MFYETILRFRFERRGTITGINGSIDNSTVGPEKANAARTSLSRSLKRLKERGLISDSIKLTARGIDVAKELSAKSR